VARASALDDSCVPFFGAAWDNAMVARWSDVEHGAGAPKVSCIPENPRDGPEDQGYDPCQPQIRIPRR